MMPRADYETVVEPADSGYRWHVNHLTARGGITVCSGTAPSVEEAETAMEEVIEQAMSPDHD